MSAEASVEKTSKKEKDAKKEDVDSGNSSLQYVNSQLVAHGFVKSPGLPLGGLSKSESAATAKCLLSLLGQRTSDSSRVEELGTKFRTLAYEHERLVTMHLSAVERADYADKESSMHKSKLTGAQRQLASSESAHRQTSAELSRTRSALTSVRTTHVNELKRRDKEIERMSERFAKLSGNEAFGKTRGLVEAALERAEEDLKALREENFAVKDNLLFAINRAEEIVHEIGALCDPRLSLSDPPIRTLDDLAASPLVPREMLRGLFDSLREVTSKLSTSSSTLSPPSSDDAQMDHLNGTIKSLRTELEDARHSAAKANVQVETLMERLSKSQRYTPDEIQELSVELSAEPVVDGEREMLLKRNAELEQERDRFTEAAVKMGKERYALEVERQQFEKERRDWEMQKIMDYVPPTSEGELSPRKSPRKTALSRASPSKSKAHKKVRMASSPPVMLAPPAFEAEAEQEAELESNHTPPTPISQPFVLPAFTLPPPSPGASLPAPISLFEKGAPAEPYSSNAATTAISVTNTISIVVDEPAAAKKSAPETPVVSRKRRQFPVGAARLHAYSPARPSPLSRILALADSSPPSEPPLPGLSFTMTAATATTAEERKEGLLTDANTNTDEMLTMELRPFLQAQTRTDQKPAEMAALAPRGGGPPHSKLTKSGAGLGKSVNKRREERGATVGDKENADVGARKSKPLRLKTRPVNAATSVAGGGGVTSRGPLRPPGVRRS